MLTLTNNFTWLLIVKFFVPVKKSEKRKGDQNNKADANKHVPCEGCKIQSLEIKMKALIKNKLFSYIFYRKMYPATCILAINNK